jgi:hypothetical protein
MKSAKTVTAAYYVDCPECEESIPDPVTGSLMWNANDSISEKTLTCDACGLQCKTPQKLYSERGTSA